ncbi:hypothetical protein H6F32_17265 [Anabaena sp. FACHB-1237]|uniref:phosphoribosyltransferase-like protein n=1 Tax=Anabaena sp. FACHB-1237 TaxID=2692769 RepID=UPI001681711B|nr:hypothetical protein [Anabaena sp. FACHB-1237]MBD2139277.1 hypothetical protein [Anabaena sp. FACHB-1237]
MNRQNLLESITTTISDYRLGEIPPMTTDHVDRWVSQFDNDEQLIILAEMNYLLSKYYISKSKAESFITEILTSEIIFGKNPSEVIPSFQFLDIQRKGSSQKDLLRLANEITMRQYGITINKPYSQPLGYIYLDDCLFSGITVYYDIERWLDQAIPNTTIYLIFLGRHISGVSYYIDRKLIPLAQRRSVSVNTGSFLKFDNNISSNQEIYECLWSKEIFDDELVNNFVKIVNENSAKKSVNPRIFRPDRLPNTETLFSTPEVRNIVESAFLRKGAYITSLPKNRQPSMRPMGYEYLESLGFGSVFITYRNIANNCPLVLWWGDTSYPSSHPFSKWYPLFPRKVNQSTN